MAYDINVIFFKWWDVLLDSIDILSTDDLKHIEILELKLQAM